MGRWSLFAILSVSCDSFCQTINHMQPTAHYTHGAGKGHCRLKFVNFEAQHNHVCHETQGLSSQHLVVRRGKPFSVALMFDGRSWDPHAEILDLEVWLGDLSERFPVQAGEQRSDPQSWSAKIHPGDLHRQSVRIHVRSPVRSSVGVYRLLVTVETAQNRWSYEAGTFVLLCNPWLEDDPVYMPLDARREEYIRSDYGLVYMGSQQNVSWRPWSFGQYEPGVLEACLKLLQVSPQHLSDRNKDYILRADPVYLSRVICAMVNCNDDLGILEGKWQGGYKGGVNPTEWSGSADILHHWLSSNCSPVRYGQCWVFAAVLCTVMRVLGIPSRVVTVFNAAHDTDASLTIEEYYSSTGEKLNLSKDSVWNFHVWVECWMRRLDLGPEFDGWQVVDPTPQEKSAGTFCCGPCPVAAVKQRCLRARFDAPFVYASVDADIMRTIVHKGRVAGRKVDGKSVGALICTKSIDSDEPENLTPAYKCLQKRRRAVHPRGLGMPGQRPRDGNDVHTAPRMSCSSGVLTSTNSLHSDSLGSEAEVSAGLEVSLNLEGVPSVGDSIEICVVVTNRSRSRRILVEHLNAQRKEYNKNPQESFWMTHKGVHIKPDEALKLHHSIPASAYESVLAGDDIVNVAAVIEDMTTKERVLSSQEFNLSSPQITIEIEGGDTIWMKKEHTAHVSFVNTLGRTLSGAVLTVKGSGLLAGKHEAKMVSLQPGDRIQKKVSIAATSPGTKLLMATFSHSGSQSAVSRSFHKVCVKTERA